MEKERIDIGETAMEELMYPDYNDPDAFKNNKLYDFHRRYKIKEIPEIRRTDYISYNQLNDEDKIEFLNTIGMERLNDLDKYGLEYKDNIFQRYYFKEFHIRDRVGDDDIGNFENSSFELIHSHVTVYYHYHISDYNSDNKNYDDRVLTASTWVSFESNDKKINPKLLITYKIFVAHAQFLFDTLFNNIEVKETKSDIELETIYFNGIKNFPLLISKSKPDSSANIEYIEMKKFLKNINYDIKQSNNLILQLLKSIRLFMDFNYYLLNLVEEDKPVSIGGESDKHTIIEYVKMKANMDKKIRINLDKDENIKLNIDPNSKNIYSHNQKVIRKLCDYKFQVCGHWHTYWFGPKNEPENRYKKLKWVNPYFKNTDKEFSIIKERYKNKK